MLAYRLPKAKANTHPSTHPPLPLLSMASILPITFASSPIHFDNRLLTFFSALHKILRPAFLATSFTLLLRSIASQRNSLHACVTQHHRHILPPHQSAFLGHRRFWFTKKRLGYIGGDTKGSWYRTKRHQQQSNLPLSGQHFFLKTSPPVQHYLWAYFFRNIGRFWSKTLLTA